MARWMGRINADPENYDLILQAYRWFAAQYEDAEKDLQPCGKRVEDVAKAIPGLTAFRWGQLRELDAILEHVDIRLLRTKRAALKKYLEGYNKLLSSTVAEKYAEAEPEVLEMRDLRNLINLLREQYAGLFKGLEQLHYQLKNITELRTHGVEDILF